MIAECRETCDRGRIGDIYNCLRRLGTKGSRAPESSMITVNEFREHFERLSRDWYEENPSVIERGDERARLRMRD